MTNNNSGDLICPCGSKKIYADCCQGFHLKTRFAKTPEQLMRSRYSAFALGGLGQYLVDTWHTESIGGLTSEEMNKRTSNWVGLDILRKSVSKSGNQGQVEFIATFEEIGHPGSRQFLYETSDFIRIDGLWVYTQGEIKDVTYPKSNDPCLCGSGIKFKKCCALYV